MEEIAEMGMLNEDKRQAAMDLLQDGYFETDLAGNFTYVNKAFCGIFGYSSAELIGENYLKFAHRINAKKTLVPPDRVSKSGIPGKLINFEIIRKDGLRRQLEISASLAADQSGEPGGYRGTVRDVTARKQMEEELRRSEERYRMIIEEIEDAYFEVDLKGRFIFINNALCKALGYTRDELIGMDQRQYAGESTIKELLTLFNRVYRTKVPVKSYTFELNRKDGSQGHCEISVSLIRNREEEIIGFRGIARDITERKENEDQIRHLATHDILTGLPNRVLFKEVLEQSIKDAHRYGGQLALLLMDLDGFKAINDTYGHEIGDRVLIICAARMRQALRASDFIARLGGDEFLILAKGNTGKTGLTTLAKTIFSIVNEPISIRGSKHHLTASIGISIYPQDGRDKQSLIRTADLAMYSAKEKGTNNHEFFSQKISHQFKGKYNAKKELTRALERNEFFLQYQPKLNLRTGALAGVEALLRWHSRSLGLIGPEQFIPAAESSGLIVALGRWVLQQACLQNVEWQKQGLPPISMAVNLSYRQLLHDGLVKDIESALLESGMEPELLELEITENRLLTLFPRVESVFYRLRGMRVRLALDDYGSGYSTLSQLRQLPMDTLKIDRSIISHLPNKKREAALVRALADYGRALNLDVVAEGVERAEQVAFLKTTACNILQGFYYSRPLSPAAMAEFMIKYRLQPP